MAPTFSKPILAHRKPITISLILLILLRYGPSVLTRVLRQAKATLSLGSSDKLSPEQLAKVLQQVYIPNPDGSKTLLVTYRDRVLKVPIRPTPTSQFEDDKKHFPLLSQQAAQKPNIDKAFLQQLRALLSRIVMPGWKTEEAGIVALHSFFLVMRTVLSIAVARLDGMIVRDLVRKDGKGFLKGLALWFLLAVPSTFTNSMIKHLQSLLALKFRTRLTRYLHDLYLSANPDLRYYRVTNHLEGVDQYLTADVEAWSNSLSGLYGNLLKPSLDLLLFTSQLSRSLGVRGTLLLFLNYYGTVAILRAVTPAFGRLAAVEARLEGEYRKGMGRVGRESEEVAFYDGGGRERDILTDAYMRLIRHVNSIYKIRIAYEWTEDYVIKYLWSAAGYALIAVPILYTRTKQSLGFAAKLKDKDRQREKDEAVAGRTETYISNRRLLLSLADAGGRMMYAYKDLLELAGLTTRLYSLTSTLLHLPQGRGVRMVQQGGAIELIGVDVGVPRTTKLENGEPEKDTMEKDLEIGTTLVKDLNLKIESGEHLMITGSNGLGKTSVARVLAGLWDAIDGTVLMPADGDPEVQIPSPSATPTPSSVPSSSSTSYNRPWPRPTIYVVPQRSYMVTGSLLEQIIYPCPYAVFSSTASNPQYFPRGPQQAIDEVLSILASVHLAYLPDREGGLSTRKEWRDVLSGGEKQRVGIARVLWWKPRYAILDECTSAVSADVEGKLYEAMKSVTVGKEGEEGMTLVTISLRRGLVKYHRMVLELKGVRKTSTSTASSTSISSNASDEETESEDGDGRNWILSRVGTKEERMSVEREIKQLEEKLRAKGQWEDRLKDLESMLAVVDLGANEDGESVGASTSESVVHVRSEDVPPVA